MDSIQRAARAVQIMEDTLVIEAFADIEKSLHEMWKLEGVPEARVELWHTQRGLDLFKNYMEATILNGEFEKAQAEEV